MPVKGTPDQVHYRVVMSEGMRLAAIYHTHPISAPIHKRRRFSDADVAVSVRFAIGGLL